MNNKTIITIVITTIAIILLINLTSCTSTIPQGNECTKDSDCGTGGCSGEICGVKGQVEQIFSACVYLEEYECLKLTECKCINGNCIWEKTDEYTNCIKKYK